MSVQDGLEAQQAMRDILFMYFDLAESYRGFGHGIDTGTFDAFKYLEVEAEPLRGFTVDIDLLWQGSAIALLCGLYDHWVEHEDVSHASPWLNRLRRFVSDGRFLHCEDVGTLIAEAFERNPGLHDPFLDQRSQLIYQKYVAGSFARLGTLRRT